MMKNLNSKSQTPNEAVLDRKAAHRDPQVAEWESEFEAAARRPLSVRMHYAFIRTYKPVLDDAPFRAFETMAEYREWCDQHLPAWLGYGRAL